MAGWHSQLNGHEIEETPVDSEGQASLVCCNPRGCKESDTTKRLNELKHPCLGIWVELSFQILKLDPREHDY